MQAGEACEAPPNLDILSSRSVPKLDTLALHPRCKLWSISSKYTEHSAIKLEDTLRSS
jgi:hypothetical protein